jgi:choline-glycine betaine transporter
VLVGLILFLAFTPLIPSLFYGHWAFLLLALVLACLPSAKKTFGESREYSLIHWLSLIFLMQISLLALHLGIFSPSHSAELLHYGLFPWGWAAILASAFGATAYWRQENAFGNSLLFPFIKTTVEKPLGIIINNTLKFAQSVTLILTFAFMILLIAGIFGFHPSAPFSEPIPLFGLFFFILFSFSKSYKRLFTRISAYPTYWLICALILVVSLALAILHALSANLQFTLPLPSLFNYLQAYPQDILSTILSLGWWLGISILASFFIAQISKGYSRRAMIMAILILPLFLAIFALLFPSLQTIEIPDSIRNIMGILGFVTSMILFMQKKMLSPLILNYLPKNGESKYRNPEFLLRKLFQMSLIFLYIFLPTGLILSAAFIFIAIFPMLIFAILLGIRQCFP